MQKSLLTLAVFLFSTATSLATNVSGVINTHTTWTKANNPYIVKGDIAIDTSASLTIEPGVEVRFDGNYIIYAYGKIMAEGTKTDKIVFTSNKLNPKKSDWKGIEVWYTTYDDTIKFSNCLFSYSGKAAIHIRSNPGIISDCIFKDNATGVVNYSFSQAYIYVTNCIFQNNDGGTWFGGRNVVKNCEFYNNLKGIENSSNGSIEIANCVFYNHNTAITYGNNIHHNVIAYSKQSALSGCAKVKYNQIWHNKIGLERAIKDSVENNSFRYNEIAIKGTTVSSSSFLMNNCIENSTLYDYYNTGVAGAYITMNYWGTTDSSTLMSRFYDFYDDFTIGKVTFLPVLTAADSGCADTIAIPPLSIKNNAVYNAAIVKVYPNPMGDKLTIASTKQIAAITITDITGKAILQQNINNTKATIRTDGLASGVYLYKIFHTDDAISTGKLLKE